MKSIEIPEICQEIPRNRQKSIYDMIWITLSDLWISKIAKSNESSGPCVTTTQHISHIALNLSRWNIWTSACDEIIFCFAQHGGLFTLVTQLIINHIRMHLISQLFQREVRNFPGIISTIKSCFFLSYITPYFMPRYYVRDVYMENILEKKLVNNLLRRSGKKVFDYEKKEHSWRNSENVETVTIINL